MNEILSDPKMAAMFMKIDTNCDGTVDWVCVCVRMCVSVSECKCVVFVLSGNVQDEFCTFMLLEYQEKDLMEGEKLPLFPYPLKVNSHTHTHVRMLNTNAPHVYQVLPNPHRDNITSILPLPLPNRPGNQSGSGQLESADGRFISVCKDGTVCFWRSNHSLQRMVQVRF